MKKLWENWGPAVLLYAAGFGILGALITAAIWVPGTQPFKRKFDFQPRTVTLYAADGGVIGKWHTRGKVYSEGESDGWFFTDNADGRLKMVAGTVLIEADKP